MNNARRDESWLAYNRPPGLHCPVNNPSHYTEGRSYEPIDVIEDWDLGFHLGNALKYISRAGRKDPASYRQDLSKAVWYLEKEMDKVHDQAVVAEMDRVNQIPSTVLPGSDDDVPFYDSEMFAEYAHDVWDAEREFFGLDKGFVLGGEVELKQPEHKDVIEFFDWHEESPCDI
jgi:hypothetical protein